MTIHEKDLATADTGIAILLKKKELTALDQRQLDFLKNERRKILNEMKVDKEVKGRK